MLAGMSECSDHAFARIRDNSLEPQHVTSSWEELIYNSFHTSPDFSVKCRSEQVRA